MPKTPEISAAGDKASREALIELLTTSLENACEQLDGWIAWKCPRRHIAEHDAFVAELRQVVQLSKARR